MSKTAVIYWTGTGNTEAMANAIASGIGDADVMPVSEADASAVAQYDKIAFGCPAMGDEVLEESEFEPFFADVEGSLSGKKVALFGSYGWGDGQWMRDWCARCEAANANIYDENGLIAHETPDGEALEACRELGRKLAAW